MSDFTFTSDDLLNDETWMNAMSKNQTQDFGRLKTSASIDKDVQLGVTTLGISDILQGSALEKPDSIAYERFNTALTEDLNSLIAEKGLGSLFTGSRTELLPYDVLYASQSAGHTESADPGTAPSPSANYTTSGGGPGSVGEGKISPPPELLNYGNGKIPTSALAPIGIGNHKLWGPAATAFRNMKDAAAKENVPLNVTDSYRDYPAQVSVKARKGNMAATPGKSNHGWGLALDMKWEDGSGGNMNSKGYKWMKANGYKFGWFHPSWGEPSGKGPHEPWHWEFRGGPGGTEQGS